MARELIRRKIVGRMLQVSTIHHTVRALRLQAVPSPFRS
jgi:hypothetical protein